MEKKEHPLKIEAKDPCFGKKKEFFIYELDENGKDCIFTAEQIAFIARRYPEH